VLTTQLLKGDTEVGHQGGVCTVISVARAETQRPTVVTAT
jgi:hypothetical protein